MLASLCAVAGAPAIGLDAAPTLSPPERERWREAALAADPCGEPNAPAGACTHRRQAPLLDANGRVRGYLTLGRRDGGFAAEDAAVRPLAEAKQVELTLTVAGEAFATVGDPSRLEQVVWNLLVKAVKFTPAGGRIAVRLERLAGSPGLTWRTTARASTRPSCRTSSTGSGRPSPSPPALRVLQAADAREAIARLRGLDETARPTVLLCDIALPGENGYGLLARIRRPEDEAGRTPQARMLAFAPSAFTRAEDRQRSLAAGFHEHLGKPLSQPDRVAPRGPAEMSVPEVRDPGKSGPGRRANP